MLRRRDAGASRLQSQPGSEDGRASRRDTRLQIGDRVFRAREESRVVTPPGRGTNRNSRSLRPPKPRPSTSVGAVRRCRGTPSMKAILPVTWFLLVVSCGSGQASVRDGSAPVADAAIVDGAAEDGRAQRLDVAVDAGPGEAGAGDALEAAGPLRCGVRVCEPGQYCLHLYSGQMPHCVARPPGGCPGGMAEECAVAGEPGCIDTGESMACVSLPASCAPAQACACLCGSSGVICSAGGNFVTCGRP
jgi:hypothetical protein